MSAAQVYLDNHAARVHADAKTLEEVKQNIAFLKARIADDQSNLDAAEEFEGVLTKAIGAGQKLLDEQGHEDRQVGQAPGEQHIEHLAHAAADRTQLFPSIQVAKPGEGGKHVCDWADCGQKLTIADGVWLHASTGRAECKPPALQEGTNGSPLLTTVLPAHGAGVTHEDA